jgi:hypothetical protein
MWRFSDDTFDVGPVEIFFNELYYPSLLSDIIAGKRPRLRAACRRSIAASPIST